MAIVDFVSDTRSVEMIILFGSYARGNWVEDKYIENGTTFEYKSDYDLLFVVKNEELANKHKAAKKLKQKILRDVDLNTSVNVIYHGIDYLNSEIENGNYFFTDIIKEGIRVYHNRKFVLAKSRQLNLKDRTKKAKLYYKEWIESAYVFEDYFKYGYQKGTLKEAIFQLHQAAERYYMTILLVFTDYKPKTHDLEELHHFSCKQDARFKTIFPRNTEEEEYLFTLLKKAYIDSRYKIGYKINKEELAYLSERVRRLGSLTVEVCKAKIEQMANDI